MKALTTKSLKDVREKMWGECHDVSKKIHEPFFQIKEILNDMPRSEIRYRIDQLQENVGIVAKEDKTWDYLRKNLKELNDKFNDLRKISDLLPM